jgi:peptidyl-prolyl cis-trans isomerase SurA
MANLTRARNILDSAARLIEQKKITFEEAVITFSDDPSKNNGGWMINPETGENKFENSQLDPKVFFVIDKLKIGEISAPVLYKTERGKDEYRLYYLKERTLPHKANIENDYARIQQWALMKKQMMAEDDWIKQKLSTTYIKLNEPYKSCPFQRSWLQK